jgi:hypothetical protein
METKRGAGPHAARNFPAIESSRPAPSQSSFLEPMYYQD